MIDAPYITHYTVHALGERSFNGEELSTQRAFTTDGVAVYKMMVRFLLELWVFTSTSGAQFNVSISVNRSLRASDLV